MQVWLDGLQTAGSFIFDIFGKLLDFLSDSYPILIAVFFMGLVVSIVSYVYSFVDIELHGTIFDKLKGNRKVSKIEYDPDNKKVFAIDNNVWIRY